LQQFLKPNSNYLKSTAVIALLRNKQHVDSAVVEKVAADRSLRSSFYTDLKKIGQQKLFPVNYANLKSLAESDIYSIATDDDEEVSSLKFIGERIANYLGENM
jgi:hypothetical protein